MKRSVTWPPRIVNGGLAMTADPEADTDNEEARGEALRQVIRLRHLEGRSANAFQLGDQLGINDATFTPSTAAAAGQIRSESARHFRRLERERRAKGVSSRLDTTTPGTLILAVEYEDLETGGRSTMEIARHA
jgi:hypothetical protein